MLTDNAIIALILSLLAGMSTIIGALIIFVTKSKNEKSLTFSLGFAGGIMISVAFLDLFPGAEIALTNYMGKSLGVIMAVVFLIAGIFLAMLIDKFVPHDEYNPEHGEKPHKDLFRVGFVSMLAIMLHNFPEGIATFMAGFSDLKMGISIAIAISLHNIPEGISVAMPIYFSTNSKWKAIKYTFLAGIAEPIGALFAFTLLKPFINEFVLGIIFAIVAGIMLYIAIEELIPSSRQYAHNRLALFAIFAGMCVMPLSHIF